MRLCGLHLNKDSFIELSDWVRKQVQNCFSTELFILASGWCQQGSFEQNKEKTFLFYSLSHTHSLYIALSLFPADTGTICSSFSGPAELRGTTCPEGKCQSYPDQTPGRRNNNPMLQLLLAQGSSTSDRKLRWPSHILHYFLTLLHKQVIRAENTPDCGCECGAVWVYNEDNNHTCQHILLSKVTFLWLTVQYLVWILYGTHSAIGLWPIRAWSLCFQMV